MYSKKTFLDSTHRDFYNDISAIICAPFACTGATFKIMADKKMAPDILKDQYYTSSVYKLCMQFKSWEVMTDRQTAGRGFLFYVPQTRPNFDKYQTRLPTHHAKHAY